MGKVLHGDCLALMATMPDNSIDMIYLDPPFFTQRDHSLSSRDLTQHYQFTDKWQNRTEYLQFLRLRLVEMRRLMQDHATLFFHCDRTASHHIRILLDEIFGEDRFISEIIWYYRRWSAHKNALQNAHQTIFIYSKTDVYTFHQLLQPYSQTTNLDQILQKRERNSVGKAAYARSEDGAVILGESKQGVPLSDVWEIPFLNPKAKERTGYPTQKPLQLLERIIQLASNSGDVVLDPFCGSGTTLVAAQELERDYIGIDHSSQAVELAQHRLTNPIRSDSPLLRQGREAYDNLPETVKAILAPLPIQLVHRNSGVDALYTEFIANHPLPIRIQRQNESVEESVQKLAKAGHKMQAKVMILIQTHDTYQNSWINSLPSNVMIIPAIELKLKELISQLKLKLEEQ